MIILVGLFSREPKDPQKKKNIEKFKELKKLVKEKKYTQALKFGIEYLETDPYHHDALFVVGGIYYMHSKYKTAISYFERSLEIGSHDVDVLLLKAYSHQKLHEYKLVIKCCEIIREVDPKNKSVFELLEQSSS